MKMCYHNNRNWSSCAAVILQFSDFLSVSKGFLWFSCHLQLRCINRRRLWTESLQMCRSPSVALVSFSSMFVVFLGTAEPFSAFRRLLFFFSSWSWVFQPWAMISGLAASSLPHLCSTQERILLVEDHLRLHPCSPVRSRRFPGFHNEM